MRAGCGSTLLSVILGRDTGLHDASVGRHAHGVPEESRGRELAPVVDTMERREVTLDVVKVVECPGNFFGPFYELGGDDVGGERC